MKNFKTPLSLAALLLLLSGRLAAAPKLYWFVPDGLRNDRSNLSVFKMAQEGLLPNIKKMMDGGAWGYSVPVYPSHTPSNFAALMTGAYPEVNGVPDGPMHIEGYPLAKPSVAGFSSTAKKVAPIWKVLEQAGKKTVVLSVPGSTPPEVDFGAVVRGRWANWGADLFAVNFESFTGDKQRAAKGKNVRLFQLGAELTKYPALKPAEGWQNPPLSNSPALEMEMLAHGATIYALLSDSTDNKAADYDTVTLSFDKAAAAATLSVSGQWTGWLPVKVMWNGIAMDSKVRLALIKTGPGEFLKLRAYFDLLNPSVVHPADAYDGLYAAAGPMADFPDNWPAQLNNYAEEKQVFLDEARMTMDWHRKAARYFLTSGQPDAFIQDIYTPNQMLESRWWLPYLSKSSDRYNSVSEAERKLLRAEVVEIYKGMDAIIGEALAGADKDTLIILSSDHGVIALNKKVLLNNFFAKEGLLSFKLDPKTGEPAVEWASAQAVHLKMHGVYIGVNRGLAGNWTRGSGQDFEALRARVMQLLSGLRDGDRKVFKEVLTREDAAAKYRLPPDRIADIVLVMTPNYGLSEDMTEDLEVLKPAEEGGYKQAIDAEKLDGMWAPFIVYGPGVKKGFELKRNISNVDQAPTILKLMGVPVPGYMQGKAVDEIFAD